MIITSQGFGHFTQGLNNQDFGIETPKMLLILDGCSGAKYSEVGTRLFAQILEKIEGIDDVEKFEENIKTAFEKIFEILKSYFNVSDEYEEQFIMDNLLFTIIACFDVGSKFVVKLFGDGYVITKNKNNNVSFLKFSYGKCPPYYAYKYCSFEGENEYKGYPFKTFVFEKSLFTNVAIASDGVLPIAKGDVKGVEHNILLANKAAVENLIKSNRSKFFDDVTIASFGGSQNV